MFLDPFAWKVIMNRLNLTFDDEGFPIEGEVFRDGAYIYII